MTMVHVGTLDDFEDEAPTKVEVDGTLVVVVRVGERLYALDDTCSHAESSLSEGELYVDDCEIECPLHGSTFDLLTGEPQCLPATEPVAVHTVKLDGDDVYIEVD